MNQKTVSREECEAWKNRADDAGRLARAHLELLSENVEWGKTVAWLDKEVDKLRSQKAALEDANGKIGRQLLEHSEEVNKRGERIVVLKSRLGIMTKLAVAQKEINEALESQLAEARRVLGIVAPYHQDCYCHDDDGLSGKCVHCVIIDAAGALRTKPEATDNRS